MGSRLGKKKQVNESKRVKRRKTSRRTKSRRPHIFDTAKVSFNQYQTVGFWTRLLRSSKKTILHNEKLILDQVQILFRGPLGLFEILDEITVELDFEIPQPVIRALADFAVDTPTDDVSIAALHVLVKLAVYSPKNEVVGIIGRRLFPTIVEALSKSSLAKETRVKGTNFSDLLMNFFFVFGMNHMKFRDMVPSILTLSTPSFFRKDNEPFIDTSKKFLAVCQRCSASRVKEHQVEVCITLTNFWCRLSKPAELAWAFECALHEEVQRKEVHNRFLWHVLDINITKTYRKRALGMVHPDLNKGRTFKTVKELRREMRKKAQTF